MNKRFRRFSARNQSTIGAYHIGTPVLVSKTGVRSHHVDSRGPLFCGSPCRHRASSSCHRLVSVLVHGLSGFPSVIFLSLSSILGSNFRPAFPGEEPSFDCTVQGGGTDEDRYILVQNGTNRVARREKLARAGGRGKKNFRPSKKSLCSTKIISCGRTPRKKIFLGQNNIPESCFFFFGARTWGPRVLQMTT
jgi:hypothetical protein